MADIGRPTNVANVVYVPNAQLTKVAVKYPLQEFAASRVLPAVQVQKESDVYYRFKPSHLNLVDTRRAIGAYPNETTWEIKDTPKYVCEEDVLEGYLDDRVKDNSDPAIAAEAATVEDVTQKLLLVKEKRVADLYKNNAVEGDAITDKWDDADTKDIEGVLKDAILTVKKACGMRPNVIIMNDVVYDAISRNPKLREDFKYSPPMANVAFSVEGMLAHMVNISNIVVAPAMYNEENKGQAQSLTEVWGDDVYVAYVNYSPALVAPSFAYEFYTMDREVSTFYDGRRNGTIYRVRSINTEHVVLEDAALRIPSVLSES